MRKLLTTALLLSSLATTALAKKVWLIGNFDSWGRTTEGYTLSETPEGSGIFKGTFGTEKLHKDGESWLMFRIQRDDPNWDTDWKQGSFGPMERDHSNISIDPASPEGTYTVKNGYLGNWMIPGYQSGYITVVFNENDNTVKISGSDIKVSAYSKPENLYLRGDLIKGWGDSVKLTQQGNKYVANGVTFVERTDGNPYSCFRFFTTDEEGEKWSTINGADQYAALAPKTVIDPYYSAKFSIYPGGDVNAPSRHAELNDFQVAPGTYDITLDFDKQIIALRKKELMGQWKYDDDSEPTKRWTQQEGSEWHDLPTFKMLDFDAANATPGRTYRWKDVEGLLGAGGLLEDKNRNNLVNIYASPLMTSTNLVYEAQGGKPVTIDYMFSSAADGSRLGYFYVKKGDTRTTAQLCQALSKHEIPTYALTNEMRASKHITRISSDGNHTVGNTDLGNIGKPGTDQESWKDDSFRGKKFTLKYYGDDYKAEAAENFPEGTKIYFYLATYQTGDELTLNPVNGDGSLRNPDSFVFSSRELNKEFGTLGNWRKSSNEVHKKYHDMFGAGIKGAVAANYKYTDADNVEQDLNLLCWEDWSQSDEFDMNDVVFSLDGVKRINTNNGTLPEIQLEGKRVSVYNAETGKNEYKHLLKVSPKDAVNGPLRSRHLQSIPVGSDYFRTPIYISRIDYTAGGRRITDKDFGNGCAKTILLSKTAYDKDATADNKGDHRLTITEDNKNNSDIQYTIDYAVVDNQYTGGSGWKQLKGLYRRGESDDEIIDLSQIEWLEGEDKKGWVEDAHDQAINAGNDFIVKEIYKARLDGIKVDKDGDGKVDDNLMDSNTVEFSLPTGTVDFKLAGMHDELDGDVKDKNKKISNGYIVEFNVNGNVGQTRNEVNISNDNIKHLSSVYTANDEDGNFSWHTFTNQLDGGIRTASLKTSDNCTFGLNVAKKPSDPVLEVAKPVITLANESRDYKALYKWNVDTSWELVGAVGADCTPLYKQWYSFNDPFEGDGKGCREHGSETSYTHEGLVQDKTFPNKSEITFEYTVRGYIPVYVNGDARLMPDGIAYSGTANEKTEVGKFAADGNPETKWCDNTQNGKNYPWLEYKYNDSVTVSRWAVLGAWGKEAWNDLLRDFKLQYFDEGSSEWKDIESITNNKDNQIVRLISEPVTAKRFRLYVTAGEQGGNKTPRVYEFTLFGSKASSQSGIKARAAAAAPSFDSYYVVEANNSGYEIGGLNTGVDSIETDADAEAEYYDLQGMRVANPRSGNVYIVIRGGKASKQIMR